MYSVYRTTNKINGKIYVGVHRETAREYFGSGKALGEAIKKYGHSVFARELLVLFETAEEAYELEAHLVDEEFVARKDTYNLHDGGCGNPNWGGWNKGMKMEYSPTPEHLEKMMTGSRAAWTEERKRRIGEANSKALKGRKQDPKVVAKRAAGLQKRYDAGMKSGMYGKKDSAETKRRKSEAQKAAWARRKAK